MHTPIYREKERADTVVVFIHGFMGSPGQFSDLLEAAYEQGCSVAAILLPGHGGTGKEFLRRGLSDWEGYLQEELTKYAGTYQNIFLVGHSMGGLLALNASLNKENNIRGLFLLATPLKLNFSLRGLTGKIRLFTWPAKHQIKNAYWQAKGFSGWPLSPRWLPHLWNFNHLMKKTAHNLPQVTAPVMAVHSRYDETVSFKSAAILYNGLGNASRERITLGKSWHAYYPEEERALVCQALLNFINRK